MTTFEDRAEKNALILELMPIQNLDSDAEEYVWAIVYIRLTYGKTSADREVNWVIHESIRVNGDDDPLIQWCNGYEELSDEQQRAFDLLTRDDESGYFEIGSVQSVEDLNENRVELIDPLAELFEFQGNEFINNCFSSYERWCQMAQDFLLEENPDPPSTLQDNRPPEETPAAPPTKARETSPFAEGNPLPCPVLPKMDFHPTEEQIAALSLFRTRQNMKVTAFAGAGKTSTLQLLARSHESNGLGPWAQKKARALLPGLRFRE